MTSRCKGRWEDRGIFNVLTCTKHTSKLQLIAVKTPPPLNSALCNKTNMKLENYSITSDFISIEVDGKVFNLHDDYNFMKILYDVAAQKLTLRWVKSKRDRVPQDLPENLMLEFTDVSLFKCKERDPEQPLSEDYCLGSLGFISKELISEIEGFSTNEESDNDDHMNLSFMSGFAIKIAAKNSRCMLN